MACGPCRIEEILTFRDLAVRAATTQGIASGVSSRAVDRLFEDKILAAKPFPSALTDALRLEIVGHCTDEQRRRAALAKLQ